MNPADVLSSYVGAPQQFDLAAFCGTWYVIQTNLALWRTRTDPAITYTPLPSDGAPQLFDEVSYRTWRGKPGTITGIDRADPQWARLFTWRGDRWYTRLLTSHWCVVDHDPACAEWAITYFSKTPFTAAGMDIYARSPKMERATIAMIVARLEQHPFLKAQAQALFDAQHRVV